MLPSCEKAGLIYSVRSLWVRSLCLEVSASGCIHFVSKWVCSLSIEVSAFTLFWSECVHFVLKWVHSLCFKVSAFTLFRSECVHSVSKWVRLLYFEVSAFTLFWSECIHFVCICVCGGWRCTGLSCTCFSVVANGGNLEEWRQLTLIHEDVGAGNHGKCPDSFSPILFKKKAHIWFVLELTWCAIMQPKKSSSSNYILAIDSGGSSWD